MSELAAFIGPDHRPEIQGGRLDKSHEPRFLLDYAAFAELPQMPLDAIAFGPKKDKVLLNLEHAVQSDDGVLILYYEDIHKKWTYVQTNTETYFVYKKNDSEQYKIKPHCLYIRGCQVDVDDTYWNILGEFYNFADAWDGKVVCSPKKQSNNESKLYQLNSSLRASRKDQSVSIGKSYVLKGKAAFKKLRADTSYIVKSLSGIRSIVVDENAFKTWKQDNIAHLPVLFQEKVSGNDLRVHVVNGNVYGKISLEKTQVDYRYDSHFSQLQDCDSLPPALQQYCIDVTSFEDNPLMGIDFIKTEGQYVVLEANPSPGWSAYHECNGITNDAFITDLLTELKHA